MRQTRYQHSLKVTEVPNVRYLAGVLFFLFISSAFAADEFWRQGITDERHEITVYRSATCGCCKGWIAHLEEHNFDVKDVTVEDVNPYKQKLNVPSNAASCHTAVVNGVVIEGHVPAEDILRLLRERPAVAGLAAPGMPPHSPGMMSVEPRGYDVLTFTRSRETTKFSSY